MLAPQFAGADGGGLGGLGEGGDGGGGDGGGGGGRGGEISKGFMVDHPIPETWFEDEKVAGLGYRVDSGVGIIVPNQDVIM